MTNKLSICIWLDRLIDWVDQVNLFDRVDLVDTFIWSYRSSTKYVDQTCQIDWFDQIDPINQIDQIDSFYQTYWMDPLD